MFIFHLRYCEQESIYLNADSFDKGQGANEEGTEQLRHLDDAEMYNFP